MPEQVTDVAGRPPAPALRPLVGAYVGYRLSGFPPGIHRGLPGRHLTFIVSLDDPVRVAGVPDPTAAPAAFGAFVSGYHVGPATIAHDGTQHGVSVDLTPLGARALLGAPAAALASEVVALHDVLGRGEAERLVDRIASAPTWPARFDVLDAALLERLGRLDGRPVARPRPEVAAAWDAVVGSGGTVPVAALARELGWSRRHLGERFRAELGVTPKEAARIVRFERARRLLERPDGPGLAAAAAAAGYYDQAHLNREWRRLAGCTPTEWLAEELPPVQDATAAPDLAGRPARR